MTSNECKDLRPSIDLYAGGDLEPAEVRRLGAHLEACPACRERLEAARAAVGLVRGLGSMGLQEELPLAQDPDFWEGMGESVMARISRLPARRSAAGRLAWFASGFAAAASLLLLVWLAGALPRSPLENALPGTRGSGVAAANPSRGNLVPVTGPVERWVSLPLEVGASSGDEAAAWPEVPVGLLRRALQERYQSPVIPASGKAKF